MQDKCEVYVKDVKSILHKHWSLNLDFCAVISYVEWVLIIIISNFQMKRGGFWFTSHKKQHKRYHSS